MKQEKGMQKSSEQLRRFGCDSRAVSFLYIQHSSG